MGWLPKWYLKRTLLPHCYVKEFGWLKYSFCSLMFYSLSIFGVLMFYSPLCYSIFGKLLPSYPLFPKIFTPFDPLYFIDLFSWTRMPFHFTSLTLSAFFLHPHIFWTFLETIVYYKRVKHWGTKIVLQKSTFYFLFLGFTH